MYKNLKISLRLLLGFGILMVLTFVIITVGATYLNKVSEFTTKLYDSPYKIANSTMGIKSDLNNLEKELRGTLLQQDSSRYKSSIDKSSNDITNYITQLKSISNLNDPQLVSNLEKSFKKEEEIRNVIITLASEGNYTDAIWKLNTEYSSVFQTTYKDVEALYDFASDKALSLKNDSISTRSTYVKNLYMIFIVITIISGTISLITSTSIIKPVGKLNELANKIANGELDVEILHNSKDEVGQLSESFGKTVLRLKEYIKYIDEVSDILNQIADGNLVIELKYEYLGDFAKIKKSLMNISSSLNDTLSKINNTAQQVDSGSTQVAIGAQALAEGATEQAGVIEELVASVNEVSEKVTKNAEHSNKAAQISETTTEVVKLGSKQMQSMIDAMNEIKSNTNEIQTIVRAIESISTQTNLLSLNAAIEAARAGDAGRGFSVVAGEIGKLADESSQATKTTISLIEKCILATENGAQIVDKTSESLNQIVESTLESKNIIRDITNASNEQSVALSEISKGIEQVSMVMQSNSSISQQSAATSEELSNQSEILKELTSRFKLRV